MPYVFSLHQESLKRKFAVYVVVAKGAHDTKLYVGKTGDNREGCNPLISRCGNHFSYNKIHSQVRNKLDDHEDRHYTYVFDHFDDYPEEDAQRRLCIDRINEMERWLNEEIQKVTQRRQNLELLNPYQAAGHVSAAEKKNRAALRTADCKIKISALVSEVERQVG
ncbi:MAG: hypothetical protein WAW02_10635 [Sideroxyarcus sp.]